MVQSIDPPEMITVHGQTAPDLPHPLGGAARHRFISPHCDDTTLSCGGTVARVAQAGLRAEVTVVFGSEPDPAVPLSPFAERLHASWRLTASQVVAIRRSEDVVAAALLGSDLDFLPFRDAIYRENRYTSPATLFGEPMRDEDDLPERLAEALGLNDRPDPATRIYCPLAIGGHVDHRHAFAAGVKLARAGWAVFFYEDLPYALEPGATDARLAAVTAAGLVLQPIVALDVVSTWKIKVLAIMAYSSQRPDLFGSLVGRADPYARFAAIMRTYAIQVGNGALCERFWRLNPGAPGASGASGVRPG